MNKCVVCFKVFEQEQTTKTTDTATAAVTTSDNPHRSRFCKKCLKKKDKSHSLYKRMERDFLNTKCSYFFDIAKREFESHTKKYYSWEGAEKNGHKHHWDGLSKLSAQMTEELINCKSLIQFRKDKSIVRRARQAGETDYRALAGFRSNKKSPVYPLKRIAKNLKIMSERLGFFMERLDSTAKSIISREFGEHRYNHLFVLQLVKNEGTLEFSVCPSILGGPDGLKEEKEEIDSDCSAISRVMKNWDKSKRSSTKEILEEERYYMWKLVDDLTDCEPKRESLDAIIYDFERFEESGGDIPMVIKDAVDLEKFLSSQPVEEKESESWDI